MPCGKAVTFSLTRPWFTHLPTFIKHWQCGSKQYGGSYYERELHISRDNTLTNNHWPDVRLKHTSVIKHRKHPMYVKLSTSSPDWAFLFGRRSKSSNNVQTGHVMAAKIITTFTSKVKNDTTVTSPVDPGRQQPIVRRASTQSAHASSQWLTL